MWYSPARLCIAFGKSSSRQATVTVRKMSTSSCVRSYMGCSEDISCDMVFSVGCRGISGTWSNSSLLSFCDFGVCRVISCIYFASFFTALCPFFITFPRGATGLAEWLNCVLCWTCWRHMELHGAISVQHRVTPGLFSQMSHLQTPYYQNLDIYIKHFPPLACVQLNCH